MANITKQDLILEIAKSTGFVRTDIKAVVEQFLGIVSEKLADGHSIELRGFGTFANKIRKSRPARNPRTGEEVFLAERFVPTFKFSNDVKARLNENDLAALQAVENETFEEELEETLQEF